jgi:hypothetical protein
VYCRMFGSLLTRRWETGQVIEGDMFYVVGARMGALGRYLLKLSLYDSNVLARFEEVMFVIFLRTVLKPCSSLDT